MVENSKIGLNHDKATGLHLKSHGHGKGLLKV